MKAEGKVIGIINPKGGTGKSTLALHIAMGMHHIRVFNSNKSNNKVVLLDTDTPQYSLVNLRKIERDSLKNPLCTFSKVKCDSIYTDGFEPLSINPKFISEMIESLELNKNKYDFTIVDVGAKLCEEDFNEDFLKCFDYILVPMNEDFEQQRSTVEFIEKTIIPSSKKLGFEYDIVLNNIHHTKETYSKNLREILENNGVRFLNTLISKKDKYVSYKFDEPTGMYSSLIYTYDEPIFELIDEIINKFNIDVIEVKQVKEKI
jgi:cellulose biosynthesis protein BcsQ